MCPSLEPNEIRNQKFTAPDPAIGTKPGTVESNAYDIAAQTILRHTASDMCVMMLHPNFVFDLAFQCHPGAPVTGVQIIRSHPWGNPKETFHLIDCLLEKLY